MLQVIHKKAPKVKSDKVNDKTGRYPNTSIHFYKILSTSKDCVKVSGQAVDTNIPTFLNAHKDQLLIG